MTKRPLATWRGREIRYLVASKSKKPESLKIRRIYLKVSCGAGDNWSVKVMSRYSKTVTGAQVESDLPSIKGRPTGCCQPCSGQVFLLTSITLMLGISERTDKLGFSRHLSFKMVTDFTTVLLL